MGQGASPVMVPLVQDVKVMLLPQGAELRAGDVAERQEPGRHLPRSTGTRMVRPVRRIAIPPGSGARPVTNSGYAYAEAGSGPSVSTKNTRYIGPSGGSGCQARAAAVAQPGGAAVAAVELEVATAGPRRSAGFSLQRTYEGLGVGLIAIADPLVAAVGWTRERVRRRTRPTLAGTRGYPL